MKRALFLSLTLSLLMLGCECGRHEEAHDDETESEDETEGEATEGADEGETEAEAPHATGPLGWTALVEADENAEEGEEGYREHRLLMWRTGPATGERPEDMTLLGHFSNWQGLFTLYIAGEEEGTERSLTLFGIRGTCEATATRALRLRVTFEPHHGDTEERLYDALEFEGCNGPFSYGAEGPVTFEELSTRTMSTPPEEQLAVVRDREQEITDDVGDEPMRIVGRELAPFHAWVLSGWETYFVRGTELVTHTEDSIIGMVTVGPRSMLVVRNQDGVVLDTVGEDSLQRVDPDAAPETTETTEQPE